jgi:transcriptional regulator with XRE-family HTH domain
MRSQHDASEPVGGAASGYRGLGDRLRTQRAASGISLRELARRIGVSASLISQIETGKVQPSVSTLYALVAELGGSFDQLLFGEPAPVGGDGPGDGLVPADRWAALLAYPPGPAIQRAGDRKAIELHRGVRWERLTPQSVPAVEFLHVVYEPGAESAPPDSFQRHTGREWCYVVAGRLHVAIGFDEYALGPGDAMTFDSSIPHRLTNRHEEPVETVWFLLR